MSSFSEYAQRWHDQGWRRIQQACTITHADVRAASTILTLVYFFMLHKNHTWISTVPDALFDPPPFSLGIFWSGFPGYTTLAIFQTLLILSLVTIGTGYRTATSGIIFFISFIVLSTARYSFGKIDHEVLLPVTVLCLALAGSSKKLNHAPALRKLFPVNPMTLQSLAIAFGMFTAGYGKMLNWVDFNMERSGFLRWFYSGYLNKGRDKLLAESVPSLPPLAIESFDYIGVFFELAPFFLLLTGAALWWRVWLTSACAFHIVNLLFLNIGFVLNWIVYMPYLLSKRLVGWITGRSAQKVLGALIIILGCWALANTWLGIPNPTRMLGWPKLERGLAMWLILVCLGLWKCTELLLASRKRAL